MFVVPTSLCVLIGRELLLSFVTVENLSNIVVFEYAEFREN